MSVRVSRRDSNLAFETSLNSMIALGVVAITVGAEFYNINVSWSSPLLTIFIYLGWPIAIVSIVSLVVFVNSKVESFDGKLFAFSGWILFCITALILASTIAYPGSKAVDSNATPEGSTHQEIEGDSNK